MDKRTRTEYSLKNASTAMAARMVSILFGYVARIVLTRTLSVDLVGINGLLTNILGAMSLSEMGIDTALVYSLYAPLSKNDTEKQKSLLALYRKIYLVIALIVALIGAFMYPLLGLLLQQPYDVRNLPLVYALFILNSSCTYICASRSLVFLADQRNYLNDYFYSVFLILQYVLQIVLLAATGNFYLYLLAQTLCNVLKNAASSLYAARRYPYLKGRPAGPVSGNEKSGIIRNTRAMLIHKIGLVIINNTDNLCLTFFSGLSAVAKYANYYLVIGSVRQICDNLVRSIAGSVGNLAAEEDKDKVYGVFRLTLFTVNWLYGFCAINLFAVLSTFIGISFGAHYVFSAPVTAFLCLNFYLNGIRQATLVFRDSLGLFWYDRYKTVAESLINLFMSILLALYVGTIGVFIGTTISIVSVSMWVEPLILYHRYFKKPLSSYLRELLPYEAVTAAGACATVFVCFLTDALSGNNLWIRLIIRLLVCLAVPNLLYFLSFHRKKEFSELFSSVFSYLRGLRHG